MNCLEFIINEKENSIKVQKCFLVKQFRVVSFKENFEVLKLYHKISEDFILISTFVKEKCDFLDISIVLKPNSLYKFLTNKGVVAIKGLHISENHSNSIFFLCKIVRIFLEPSKDFIIKLEYNVCFFLATLEDACADRTSVVIEVEGEDITLCTLSHGYCNNSVFNYIYDSGEKLSIKALGRSNVSILGSILN